MPSRIHANSAPNDRERDVLNHVVTAQRELEAALGKLRIAERRESKSVRRRYAYRKMIRDLIETANRLARMRGTHLIPDDLEVELPPPLVASSSKTVQTIGEG